MRKTLALTVAVVLLVFALASCTGDIWTSISGFMHGTEGNVYIEQGLIVVDTAEVDEVATVITDLLGDGTTDTPMDEATQDEVLETLAEVFTSEQKTDALVEQLQEPANPSDDTVTRLAGYLPEGVPKEDLTQGDILAAELISSFLEDVPTVEDFALLTPEEQLAIVSEGMQIVETVKKISPIGEVTVDSIVTGLLDEFLSQFGPRAKTVVPLTSEEEEIAAQILAYVRPVANSLIAAIGTDPVDGKLLPAGLSTVINNYSITRAAYEALAPGLAASGAVLEMTDLVDYALSVLFTEANAYLAGATPDPIVFIDVLDALVPLLGWEVGDALDVPDWATAADWEAMLETYVQDLSFVGNFETMEATISAIWMAVPSLEVQVQYLNEAKSQARTTLEGMGVVFTGGEE